MKRKILAAILCVSMAMSMTACGSGSKTTESAANITEAGAEESAEAQETNVSKEAASDTMINCNDVTPDDSRKNTANTDERYDKVTITSNLEIAELQPYNVDDASKMDIVSEIYEALFEMYGLDDYRTRLASDDVEIVDDTHYRVKIYENIVDSEGNPITATDVVFSYDLAYESGYGNDWNYYDSAKAIDDYTVEFIFKEPLNSLTAFTNLFTKVYIVSEEAYTAHNMATDPVGTGPYAVKSFVPGSGVTLQARDDYWQTEDKKSERAASNAETIQFDIVGDDSLALVALQEGKSDFKFMRDDWSMFQAGGQYEGEVNLYAHNSTQSHTILPNCGENSPCADENLRLAIFYAIDSNSICEAISSDTKFPSNADVSKMAADYQETWDTYAKDTYQNIYDPNLAKECLEKSGYNGETLTILLESNDEKKLEAQLVQGYLSAIGINCELQIYDHSVVSTYQADPTYWDILIYSGNANDYSISKWMTEYGAAKNNGTSINFIEDEDFQEMLNKCSTADGYSAELTQQIGEYIIDNAYAYSTFYASEIYAYSPKFASIYLDFWGHTLYGACEYYLD